MTARTETPPEPVDAAAGASAVEPSPAEAVQGGEPSDRRQARRTPTRRNDGVSDALRAAYRSTLEEDVPTELLDLIRKLS